MNGGDNINTVLSVPYKIKFKALSESFPFFDRGGEKTCCITGN
jgi:hypothetical protein